MVKHLRPRSPDGYGNIYTPHAGSMIIQVQREGGLANRTIVLTPRQVAILRTLWSPAGKLLIALIVATWVFFAIQSARVPLLTARVQELEHAASKLDTLQVALSRLHQRYDQVRSLLGHAPGTSPAPPVAAAPTTSPPAPARAAPGSPGADAVR
jgi:hypothetical protein